MPVLKTLAAPNGVSVAYHKVVQATYDVSAQQLNVNVGSWATQDAYNAGNGLAWSWPLVLPASALTGLDAALLVLDTFTGGTVVDDSLTTLAAVQSRQWAKVKDARDAVIYGGFPWTGTDNVTSTFDSDIIAQGRITGAVVLAQAAIAAGEASAFSKAWTLADNTVRTLSATDMVSVGITLGTFVQTQIDKGTALRTSINTATTTDAAEAVAWS